MTGDDTVRLTYQELAEMRGISLASARRMVHRHKWPKQLGNDGLSRIAVPTEFVRTGGDATDDDGDDTTDDAITNAPNGVTDDATTDAATMQVVPIDEALVAFAKVTTDAINGATTGVIMALQEAVTTLRVELHTQRDRAETAEKLVRELQAQLAARRSWWPWRR